VYFLAHTWSLNVSSENAPQRQRPNGSSREKWQSTGPPGAVAFTVAEFCEAHRISRSFLYSEWKVGRGPRFMRAGVKRIITGEAAADWRREREAEAAAEKRETGT
jgi:hypothetical protein